MIICDLKLLLFLPCHPCNVIFRAICGFAAHCWAPPASQPPSLVLAWPFCFLPVDEAERVSGCI